MCLPPQLLFSLSSIWPVLLPHGQGQELVGNKNSLRGNGWGSINKRWGCPPFLRHEEEDQIHRERLLLLFRGVLRWTGLKTVLIGVQLPCHVVFISATQHSESAVCIHTSPLYWISVPFRSPRSIEQRSLSYTVGSQQFFILCMLSIVYLCQSQSPSSSHPPFPFGVHLFVLCVSVSISVFQIRSSIPIFFRFHIYTHVLIDDICLSL